MLDIIGKRNWYFLLSLLLIVPGVLSLIFWGLRPSIDFVGGSRMVFVVEEKKQLLSATELLNQQFKKEKLEVVSVASADRRIVVRTKAVDEKKNAKLLKQIEKSPIKIKQDEFETIGPTIGNETTLNAFKAVGFASLLIVLYIAWSFRKVPKPTSSWKFGVCAVIALVHDALLVVGAFSLLGHFYQVEVDSLFVTALLTVIGFSVHDTIVVFDRIRENLRINGGVNFERTVNNSILQTLSRSLNTSITALLVLFTMLVFGGESLRWFVFALFLGIASGTYSSIFNASAILVVWHNFDERRKKN